MAELLNPTEAEWLLGWIRLPRREQGCHNTLKKPLSSSAPGFSALGTRLQKATMGS